MNKQAEELVTQAGQKVLDYLEATEGFAIEQAPILAQEIIRWGVWGHVGLTLLFLALTVVSSSIAFRLFQKYKASKRGIHEEWILCFSAAASACFVFFFIMFCVNLHLTAKPLIAPRLYILEEIGKLL